MINNYFKTAFRNLRHNILFSLINVLGLSIGISAALIIYLIVHYEFSFDKSQKDADRIYRVVTDMKFSGDLIYNSGVPSPLPEATRQEVTGLDEATAFYTTRPSVSIPVDAHRPAVFKDQTNVIFADNHYFRLFSNYQWLAGSLQTALKDPFHVVLTAERATIYFPGLTPSACIGRQIVYDDSIQVTVSGVLKAPDVITDFTFKEFISLATIPATGLKNSKSFDSWGGVSSASQFFVRLAPGTKPVQIETKLARLRKKFSNDRTDNGNTTTHHLEPLGDLHFSAIYGSFDQPQANRSTLYGLILVAAFLLLLACINFVNLTTALATRRAKEIGIRKTLGSSKRQLIVQFLGETFLLTLLSLALSLLLTPWLLHIFSDFIPPNLHFQWQGQPDIYLFGAALLLVVTLLSGFYPALLLSRFRPVLVLKNQLYATAATTRSAWLRKILTVSQFAIAQIFIMATLIVGRQIRFSLDSDLGFKKDAIVYFNTPRNGSETKRAALLQKIRSLPGIAMVATGGGPPSSSGWAQASMEYKDGKKEISAQVQNKAGDTNYLALYHIPLLAGRNFRSTDTLHQVLINNTLAKVLGFTDPEQAIGKSIQNGKPFPIIGVITDFHQGSMHTPIKPMIITFGNNNNHTFHIALQSQTAGAGWNATLSEIQKDYKVIFPENDFSYQFFDETIAKFYTAEQHISRLLKWATALTILISCLGLTGLVIYTTNQRTREIGIRKVLGASITRILSLLSKDYIELIVIAFLIATPVACWALHQWLETFAYRTPMYWWLFPLSGGTMMTIALAVMSVRTIRTASANPVNSLRSE